MRFTVSFQGDVTMKLDDKEEVKPIVYSLSLQSAIVDAIRPSGYAKDHFVDVKEKMIVDF